MLSQIKENYFLKKEYSFTVCIESESIRSEPYFIGHKMKYNFFETIHQSFVSEVGTQYVLIRLESSVRTDTYFWVFAQCVLQQPPFLKGERSKLLICHHLRLRKPIAQWSFACMVFQAE